LEASTPKPYTERFYRDWVKPQENLTRFRVTLEQSDLEIFCDRPLAAEATDALRWVRRELKRYIRDDAELVKSLAPRDLLPNPPAIIRRMAAAAARWEVGPMAGVAGAVAGEVGRALAPLCETVIVENGGDVFARAPRPVLFRLYAGEDSPFASQIGFEVDASEGVGVCTSSGVVGPSLSLGSADAVVAIADDPAEADVAATALANRIQVPGDVGRVVEEERQRARLRGLVACAGNTIGFWGDLKLRRLRRQ
jgi:ApbE superfamily uncharacterized protein (UPF0280 family)